jgi:chromosome partitioning protein
LLHRRLCGSALTENCSTWNNYSYRDANSSQRARCAIFPRVFHRNLPFAQNARLHLKSASAYSAFTLAILPKLMGRVIAVANQKGGVGKTTTAINLAASLAAAEVDCLLVDCDPQSNATSGLGLPKDPERLSTYHLLKQAADPADALQRTELDQLWIVPSHKNLIGANIELVDAERREFRLRDALEPLRSLFQFIVLDCPPALDLLTLNALVAADAVLIPMQAEYFALEGVSELMDTVDRIRQSFNPNLGIEGVVLTMYDERTNLAQAVTDELKNFFGDRLCSTTIPRNVRLAEAPSHGKPALVYDVRSRGAESYIKLAKELMDRHGVVVHESEESTSGAEAPVSSAAGDAGLKPCSTLEPSGPEATASAGTSIGTDSGGMPGTTSEAPGAEAPVFSAADDAGLKPCSTLEHSSNFEPSGPKAAASAGTSNGTDSGAMPDSGLEHSAVADVTEQAEAQVSAATAEDWTAVDPDDEPLFAWFDAALVEAVAADSMGQVSSELVGAEQQGAD